MVEIRLQVGDGSGGAMVGPMGPPGPPGPPSGPSNSGALEITVKPGKSFGFGFKGWQWHIYRPYDGFGSASWWDAQHVNYKIGWARTKDHALRKARRQVMRLKERWESFNQGEDKPVVEVWHG